MVEPTDSISASTSTSSQYYEVYQNLLSSRYEGSDFGQTSTMYQLEMASAMQSVMDLTNEVQKQDKQNAEEAGEPNSTVISF
ncbi:MAG: hypothetical protein P0S93_06360 [Candidatus Neptunochlamydia sp.]|nr:hypothetical protein [Candidatus Neptunochlamydia sp.]